jgi:hypothetical protein
MIMSSNRRTTPRPGAVYRLAFTEARGIKERNARREAVVDHLVSWSGLTILSQQPEGTQCWVWVLISRPVPEETVRAFVKECPFYVPKSFKRLGWAAALAADSSLPAADSSLD